MLRPTIHYSTHRLDEAKNITTLRLANRLVEATLLPNVEENNRTKISKLKCSATNPHSMQCFANATNDSTLHPNYRLVEATLLKDVEEKLDKPICGQAKMLCLGQSSTGWSFVRPQTHEWSPTIISFDERHDAVVSLQASGSNLAADHRREVEQVNLSSSKNAPVTIKS